MTRTAPATEPAAPALPSRLRMVVTRLARRLRQQGEAAASPTQLAALATIERDGPLTLGALAAIERVRPPTITAAVGRLEEQGLVHRRTDARDRRVARVEITAHGGRLLAQTAGQPRHNHAQPARKRRRGGLGGGSGSRHRFDQLLSLANYSGTL